MNHSGACAWLPYATMRASGVRPRSRAAAAVVTMTAAAPSEIEEDEAAVTVPSLPKAGFRLAILRYVDRERRLVLFDELLALARRDLDRRDLGGEVAFLDGALRAPHGLRAEGVLLLARVAVLGRGLIGERAHRAAVPRTLQSVVQHVIEDLTVTVAVTAAGLGQQVRRVGHRLEAAGEHGSRVAGANLVGREHHRLHARAAHLVDRRRRHARAQRRPASAACRAGA